MSLHPQIRWQSSNTLKLKMSMPVTLLTACLLIITVAMMFGVFRKELQQTIGREQAALVRILAEQIDERLGSVENHLLVLATKIDPLAFSTPALAQEFLEQQWSSQLMFGSGLALFGPDGSLLATSQGKPCMCRENCPWQRQLQLTLRSRAPHILPYVPPAEVVAPAEPQPMVLFSVPLFDPDGNLLGAMGGAMEMLGSDILGYLRNFSHGDGSYLSLVGSNYCLIIESSGNWHLVPVDKWQKPRLSRVQNKAQVETGIFPGSSGDATLSSITSLDKIDLVIGVHEPVNRVYAPLVTLRQELALALAGEIIVAALAVWLLMRHLMKPLQILTRKIVAAEHSERSAGEAGTELLVPVHGDELAVLQKCFDQLLQRVANQRGRLQRQLEQLQSLLDAVPNPIFYTDDQGHYTGFNKAFKQHIGTPRHLELGDNVEQGLPQSIVRIVANCGTHGGFNHRSEQEVLFADGVKHPVIFSAATYQRIDSATPGVVGTLIDISTQREVEEKLRKLSRAVEQSPNSIIVTDMYGKIEYVNSTFCRVTGYAEDEVIGANPRVLNAGSTPKEYFKTLWQTILSGHDWRGEFRNRRKNGEMFWEYALISPLKGNSGEVTHFVAVKQDITERKLADRREELVAKVLSLMSVSGARADRIQDILHLIRDFTGCDYVGLHLKEADSHPYYRSMGLESGAGLSDGKIEYDFDAALAAIQDFSPDSFCSHVLEDKIEGSRPCFTPKGSFWSAPGRKCADNIKSDACGYRFCQCLGVESVAMIPLRIENQNIGLLQIIAAEKNRITMGTVEFLESIARSIAMAFEHRQVTAQLQEQENRLDFLTQYDPLTGLPNRKLLGEKLQEIVSTVRRNGEEGALLLFDIDRFKTVNDSLGHSQGDYLLQEIARRLSAALEPDDLLARIGGDEFVVLLSHTNGLQQVSSRVQQLMGHLTQVVRIADFELYVTASVGISVFPADGEDLESLLGLAEVAMYRAKQSGRNCYQFYRTEMNANTLELLHIESQLRVALERNQFEVYYQPKVNLHTGEIIGAEALLRWHHPELGIVSPADFIPVAEDTGLIVPIGQWVLYTACTQALVWNELFARRVRLAVNLSARQFQEPDLLEQLDQVIGTSGVMSAAIELEITESVAMNNVEESISTMGAMRTRGFKLAIDDFGTGYSSLSYLKRFPIDCLKIDKSFVKNILTEQNDAAIASSVVALAHSMNLQVVAEGIEDREQMAFLQQLGCNEGQGFLFARPMPAAEFEAFVSSWSGLPA